MVNIFSAGTVGTGEGYGVFFSYDVGVKRKRAPEIRHNAIFEMHITIENRFVFQIEF